ncbi:MAG: hypothetical protein U1F43_17295 [Myxococcota bacterium]
MKSILPLALTALALAWAPSALAADGPFSVNTSFAPARSTSLKVIGDAGLTVTAEVSGQVMSDQTPLVFQLPDQDDFIPVTIRAPSGASTRMKIETRAHTQTILQVVVASGGGPERGPRYIGTVQSTMGRCAEDQRVDLRLDFVLQGRAVRSADVPLSGQKVQLELPAGVYDVRIFKKNGGEGEYTTTAKLAVQADGWNLRHGCEASADSYAGVWHDPKGQVVKLVRVGVGTGDLPLFRVEWPGNGSGIGFVLSDGTLAVTGGRGPTMAFVYRQQNDGLAARWFASGKFSDVPSTAIAMASETASGPNAYGGTYSVSGRALTGNAYDGSLQIDPRGPLFGLHWTLSNGSSVEGVGLAQGQELAVGAGQPGSFIALLAFEGTGLACKFAVVGQPAVTTETLSR